MTEHIGQLEVRDIKPAKSATPNTVARQLVQAIHLPGPEFKELLRDYDAAPHTPSSHELEELDHTISNAAYQIEQLVAKFQWLRDVDIDELLKDSDTDQLVRSLLKKYRIRLAIAFVKQYWEGKLPILDNLLYARHSTNLQTLPQFNGGELTSAHMDELQALLLQAAVESIKLMKQRINGDSAMLERSQNIVYDLKKAVKNKKKNNSQKPTEAAPESPPSTQWPPPLPVIGNDALAQQVFFHKSAMLDASHATRADIVSTHNERLEFKGDSILDFIICELLYNEFPDDTEGALSIKKASLVCNDTLFDLSVTYKLHERLQTSTDLRQKIYGNSEDGYPDPQNKNKAIADVFEAYIAGVALDQGLIVVQKWLHRLYEPLIADMRSQKPAAEVNRNAKNELYRKVGSAQQQIQYVSLGDDINAQTHTVLCLIDGEEVAQGTDRTVKLAGLRAAMAALKKPELVERYASKRRELPRTAPSTSRS